MSYYQMPDPEQVYEIAPSPKGDWVNISTDTNAVVANEYAKQLRHVNIRGIERHGQFPISGDALGSTKVTGILWSKS